VATSPAELRTVFVRWFLSTDYGTPCSCT
jgi:hypothetical protein